MNIEGLKKRIGELSIKEKQELIKYIKNSYTIFDEHSDVKCCPNCQSTKIIKNGKRKGVQNYICKNCASHFTYKTNTVLSGMIELNKWNRFVENFMSLNLTSLDELSRTLDITEQTALNWRHKLLSALSLSTYDLKFKNETVEFDETFFLISRKGRRGLDLGKNRSWYRHWRKSQVGESNYNVKVFFTYGRSSKQMELYKSHMGRTSSEDLAKYILPTKFKDVTFYTDAHRSYWKFFRNSSHQHEIFKGRFHVGIDKNVHNQTVNAYTRDFKNFVNRTLKGVSTKYLTNYIKWYQFIYSVKTQLKNDLAENKKIQYNITDKICQEVVSDRNGLEIFRQKEYGFLQFLKQNGRTNYGNCKNHYYYRLTG